MVNRISRRVILATLIAYSVGYLVFVIYAIFVFPAREVMVAFQWHWILNTAAATLIENVVPLQIAALVLFFSLIAGRRAREAGEFSSLSVFRSVLPVVVVQTAILAVLVAAVLPLLHDNADSAVRQSATARVLLDRATAAESRGDYRDAVSSYRRYLRINPGDEEVEQALADAQTRTAARPAADEVTAAPPMRRSELRDLTGRELLERSQDAYEQEDFFTAHFYAQLALESGQVPTPQAERLASQAWERIRRMDGDRQELRERELFRRKRAAYEDLLAGRAVDAYYAFDALIEEFETDRDLERYRREAEELARESALFIDELEASAAFPGYRDMVFRNQITREPDADGAVHELIYIENLIPSDRGVFATGVEVLRYRAGTTVAFHIAAEYAKLRGNYIIMRALDREDPERAVEPKLLAGEFPGEFAQVLPLGPDTDTLVEFARLRADLGSGSLAGLLQLLRSEVRLGYDHGELRFELMMRLLIPFSFIVLSIAAFGIGIRLRGRYLRIPPILTAIGIVLVPLAAVVAYGIYRYVWQTIAAILALRFSLSTGLAAFAGIQAVLVFAVLIWVALSSVSES